MGFAEGDAARDVPGNRAVWVADSANFGGIQGFWISAWQAATLIPPKGFGWASNAPVVTGPPPASGPVEVDRVALLSDVMGGTVSRERYAELLPHVADALIRSDCFTVNRIAQWVAQIGHESVGLKFWRELWGPTADQRSYEGRKDLGNNQTGDGQRFLGRGPIQITGRHNYGVLSAWSHDRGYVDSPTYFVDNPQLLESDQYGFLGAIWYWTVARANINSMADRRDLEGVTRAINGGLNGLADRRARFDRALSRGDALLSLVTAPDEPAPEPETVVEEPGLVVVDEYGPPEQLVEAPWSEIVELLRENNTLLRQLARVNVEMAGLMAEEK